MNPKPTFQTLQLDCLLEILNYVPLPECMFLRASCRHLKTAVGEHFRTGVRTLPVLLSAHYSPESVTQYEELIAKYKVSTRKFYKMSFGSTSGVSQWQNWEMKNKCFDQKSYFRSENYLVLFDMTKFDAFMDFITKYLPGITKLALISDHDDYFRKIPSILSLYRKQLKVLLLDRTYRSFEDAFIRSSTEFRELWILSHKSLVSIHDLETLEELYFFTRDGLYFHPYNGHSDYDNFVESMCRLFDVSRKIRVLHLNPDRGSEIEDEVRHFRPEISEVEELACYLPTNFFQPNTSYPRLKKCIFLGHPTVVYRWPLELKNLQNLEEIEFSTGEFTIRPDQMKILNSIPNLQRFHCLRLGLQMDSDDHTWMSNKTVKFIKIDGFNYREMTEEAVEKFIQFLRVCMRFFKALEKLFIRKPFMELTGSDLL